MIREDQGGGGYTLSTPPIPILELAQTTLFRLSAKYFFVQNSSLTFDPTA
jgi:hypothetical protein